MFMLTARELRLLAFIVGAALLGVAVQHWRGSAGVETAVAAAGESAR